MQIMTVLNFKTGYVSHGLVVMDHRRILQHYTQEWFLIDLVASLPLEQFVPLSTLDKNDRKMIKILKYFKLPKLLRLGRVVKYFRKYMKYSGVLQILSMLMILLHLGAFILFIYY
jgi:hypothetical protein